MNRAKELRFLFTTVSKALFMKKYRIIRNINFTLNKFFKGRVGGACEYGNELSGFIKCGEFLD